MVVVLSFDPSEDFQSATVFNSYKEAAEFSDSLYDQRDAFLIELEPTPDQLLEMHLVSLCDWESLIHV